MNLSKMLAFDGRLADDDDSKAFMMMLHEEEAVHIATLTEAAKKCALKLGRIGLVEIRKATVHGAPHAWVALTTDGRRYTQHRFSQWLDELQKWREIEGEGHSALTSKDVVKELKEIRERIEKENRNEKPGT